MNTQTLEALSAAHSVQQGPESGRSRENAIRSFLRPLLPEGVGISTGFVLDAGGQVSGQQDIIIYRRDYHPVFLVNDIGYFLAEAVIAVIQVRARISSREALRSAMENVVSVKRLDRTAGGINYVVIGGSKGPPFHQDVFNHQIFAYWPPQQFGPGMSMPLSPDAPPPTPEQETS